MSLGADALVVTLPVGGEPQLITEYMTGADGAQVINTGTVGTVLLGSDGNIGAGHSVPLPPGTAVPWTRDGALYAATAGDATGPIQLVVSDRIGGWEPSPEVVGAAVAAQLLATGIPDVISESVVFSGFIDASWGTGSGVVLNVAGFSHLTIFVNNFSTSTPWEIGLSYLTPGPNAFPLIERVIGNAVTSSFGVTPATGTLQLRSAAVGARVVIVGSNRRQDAAFIDYDADPDNIYTYTAPTNPETLAAGASCQLQPPTTQFSTPNQPDSIGAGSMFAIFRFTNAAADKGRYYIAPHQGAGVATMVVADKAEAYVNGQGFYEVSKMITVPYGFKLFYMATTAQTITPVVSMVPSPS